VLDDRHQRRRAHAEHQHAVGRFERAEQTALAAHHDVAVAERREVDGRVIDRVVGLRELAQPQEQPAPQRDLQQRAREQGHGGDDQRRDAAQQAVPDRRGMAHVMAHAPERRRHLHHQAQQHQRQADQEVGQGHGRSFDEAAGTAPAACGRRCACTAGAPA